MAISLARAIKSFKEDESWINKTLIGGVVLLLYFGTTGFADAHKTELSGFLAFIIGTLTWIYVSGFYSSTGNKMLNENTNAMCEWCKPNQLLIGFKYITGSFIFGLFIGLILIIPAVICGVLIAFAGYTANIFANLFIKLFILVIGILAAIYIVQFTNIVVLSFYKNLKLRDMLAFKRHFRILKENQGLSWSLIGKDILWGLLFALVIAISAVSIIGVVLIPFLYFIAAIIAVNLLVQYGREIEISKYL